MNNYYSLLSTQRSGCHAISNWLLHQNSNVNRDLPMSKLHEGIDAWSITSNNKYTGILFNNLSDSDKEIASYRRDGEVNVVSLHETGRSLDLRKDKPTERLIKYFDLRQAYCLIALRDFRNFAASMYFKHGVLHNQVASTWEDRAKLIVNLKNQPQNFHFINYNAWFISADYRRELCVKLGLHFTDKGFSTVPHFGGGSSFHGKEFDGKNTEMEVLSRYKYYEHNSHFQSILSTYAKDVAISDFLFGKPNSWKIL